MDEVEFVDEGNVGGQVCLLLFCTLLLTFFHDIQSEQDDVFLVSFKTSSFEFEGEEEVDDDVDEVLGEGEVGGATPSMQTIFESLLKSNHFIMNFIYFCCSDEYTNYSFYRISQK